MQRSQPLPSTRAAARRREGRELAAITWDTFNPGMLAGPRWPRAIAGWLLKPYLHGLDLYLTQPQRSENDAFISLYSPPDLLRLRSARLARRSSSAAASRSSASTSSGGGAGVHREQRERAGWGSAAPGTGSCSAPAHWAAAATFCAAGSAHRLPRWVLAAAGITLAGETAKAPTGAAALVARGVPKPPRLRAKRLGDAA